MSVLQRCAERVCPQIDVRAWVLDDTSFPKSGYASPGVKRQYCGQLGKRANCQVGVSLHAAGDRYTLPLGWALHLPADWIGDKARMQRAQVPAGTCFKTKHELALELIDTTVDWEVEPAPVLGDQAYGDWTDLRLALAERELTYCMNVTRTLGLYPGGTRFVVPRPTGLSGRQLRLCKYADVQCTADLTGGQGELLQGNWTEWHDAVRVEGGDGSLRPHQQFHDGRMAQSAGCGTGRRLVHRAEGHHDL